MANPKKLFDPGFHAFTISYNGYANRVISEIKLTHAFDLSKIRGGKIPYTPIDSKALWDTGATNSVITPDTAKDLKLVPTGITEVVHFGGKKQCNTYMVNLFLPNKVIIPGVSVSESDAIIDDFGVIIGMDIIARGDFSITNTNGITTVSYRLPSIHRIDYVKEHIRIRYKNSDKYGPCPCEKRDDKGKRTIFKHCCG